MKIAKKPFFNFSPETFYSKFEKRNWNEKKSFISFYKNEKMLFPQKLYKSLKLNNKDA